MVVNQRSYFEVTNREVNSNNPCGLTACPQNIIVSGQVLLCSNSDGLFQEIRSRVQKLWIEKYQHEVVNLQELTWIFAFC